MLKGLDFLHKEGIIHRDIKGANLLVTKKGVLKLADFGLAVRLEECNKNASVAGTPFWMAPEVIEGQDKVSSACDIWSLGCTILEMLTGKPPYSDFEGIGAMYRMTIDAHPPLPDNLSPDLKAFLLRCFIKDPVNRPSAETLMEDKWIKQFSALKSTESPKFEKKRSVSHHEKGKSVDMTGQLNSILSAKKNIIPKAHGLSPSKMDSIKRKSTSPANKLGQPIDTDEEESDKEEGDREKSKTINLKDNLPKRDLGGKSSISSYEGNVFFKRTGPSEVFLRNNNEIRDIEGIQRQTSKALIKLEIVSGNNKQSDQVNLTKKIEKMAKNIQSIADKGIQNLLQNEVIKVNYRKLKAQAETKLGAKMLKNEETAFLAESLFLFDKNTVEEILFRIAELIYSGEVTDLVFLDRFQFSRVLKNLILSPEALHAYLYILNFVKT